MKAHMALFLMTNNTLKSKNTSFKISSRHMISVLAKYMEESTSKFTDLILFNQSGTKTKPVIYSRTSDNNQMKVEVYILFISLKIKKNDK